MKIKIAHNVKFCVHGCNIFQQILEFFKEVSWITWRAININENPTEARIRYVKTNRFKCGIVRAGVGVTLNSFEIRKPTPPPRPTGRGRWWKV